MKQPSPLKRYRDWKRTSFDVGCVFARYLAGKPDRFAQRTAIVSGTDPGKIARTIARRMSAYVADPEIAAAALVLPDVNDLPTLANAALALGSEEDWAVTRSILVGTSIGDVVAFNIVRAVPKRGGGAVPSEALVLGPFPQFPNTRRAPVTALEMFVGLAPTHQRDGKPTVKAHLADILIDGLPSEVFDHMWESSKTERLRSLGGPDDRAKAKVSFIVPMAVAELIGCLP